MHAPESVTTPQVGAAYNYHAVSSSYAFLFPFFLSFFCWKFWIMLEVYIIKLINYFVFVSLAIGISAFVSLQQFPK